MKFSASLYYLQETQCISEKKIPQGKPATKGFISS